MAISRNNLQPVQISEIFHLAFLGVLQGVAGAGSFALKGGGNLRFYFRSLRYSEDIDLDGFARDTAAFSRKVEKAFASPQLAKLLALFDIKLAYLNPKDRTTTKEKWVIGLTHASTGKSPIYTRVEISHRAYGLDAYLETRPVDFTAVEPYAPLAAPVVAHYVPRGALIQKVWALQDRKETQPRDVFDIDHLVRMFPGAPATGLLEERVIKAAIDRAYEIRFGEYRTKVVTFLDPAVRSAYDSADAWEAMQVRVVTALERMLR
jgi:predicted nucleotidyltransferase component of viral defense system